MSALSQGLMLIGNANEVATRPVQETQHPYKVQ